MATDLLYATHFPDPIHHRARHPGPDELPGHKFGLRRGMRVRGRAQECMTVRRGLSVVGQPKGVPFCPPVLLVWV